ncbi:efflux RND transporter periplasmic adaptor subunit [uncultured Ferrimonas sp.]|uniref:efflux RND transporter periplasmic adaptor subunit n=1 Tax=uncultured Ferrimonas sp. TaxID=432640 RepID=UPI0026335B75|nr:efflux RND transporter periplasmic adaptor subunit [uncultured Ferrimonas sp.]
MKKTLLLLSVTAALGLAGCDNGSQAPQAQVKPRPAKLFTVEDARTAQMQSFPAVVAAAESANLAFQVSGLIQTITVDEGEEVKQGDLLAQLDDTDFKSNLVSAEAQYRNAESSYQRAVKLKQTNAISQSDLEELTSNRDVTRSQFETAQKALNDTSLRAPYDGVIAKLPVSQLDNISAGTLVATVFAADLMEVSINVPAALMARSNDASGLSAYVVLPSAPQVQIPANFNSVVLEADAASQTYEVTFHFQAPEGQVVLPGMNAQLHVSRSLAEGESQPFSVPLPAVLAEADKHFVWLYDQQQHTISKRYVEIAPSVGDSIDVISGVEAGDMIVAAGGDFLSAGIQIRPWQR